MPKTALIEMKVVRKAILNNIDFMINLLGCNVLSLVVARLLQIRKILRFYKSDIYFRFDHRMFLIEMNDVNNIIYNNFE